MNVVCAVMFCLAARWAVAIHVNGEQEDWKTKLTLGQYYQYQPQTTCPVDSECVPLASCPTLANLMDHSCLNTVRAGSLRCGYLGSGFVCCPKTNEQSANWHISPYFPVTGIERRIDEKRCGRAMVQGERYKGIGSHPWVVRIGFKNTATGEIKYPCAGSILSKRVLLTAAHCALAKADNYKLFSARIGEWRVDSTLDCGDQFCTLPIQDVPISHVIIHSGYDQPTFKNDIALLVLRADINYTISAQPICILDSWSQPSNQAILVGWGRTAGQLATSPIQQVMDIPVVNLQQCINIYGRKMPVSDDQLCAGGQYGRDACEGFGGAPLIVKHSDTYYQIGILSYGSTQCGAAGIPSVYTSIKKYSQWIKENTPVVYS